MDMNRLILGVAAALMLSVSQAGADGLPSRGAVRGHDDFVAPSVPAWNGFYLGLGVGFGAQNVGVDAGVVDGVDVGNIDQGGEGVFGTVILGFDRAIGSRWVAGLFADYDYSDISGDVGGGISLNHNFSWAVGGRLGFLASPTTLVYGTGGYTQAEFEINNGAQSVAETFDGYFVGAGIEALLRDNWSLKLEYRFSDFGENELAGVNTDPSLHTARAVLSYRFPTR
jgi:outer membrane immunogenic protein